MVLLSHPDAVLLVCSTCVLLCFDLKQAVRHPRISILVSVLTMGGLIPQGVFPTWALVEAGGMGSGYSTGLISSACYYTCVCSTYIVHPESP